MRNIQKDPQTPQQQALSHQQYVPFPSNFTPVIDKDGIIEPAWHQLLYSLWSASGLSKNALDQVAAFLTIEGQNIVEVYNAQSSTLLGYLNYQPTAVPNVVLAEADFQMVLPTQTYLVDSTRGIIIGTLPTGPIQGDEFVVSDAGGVAGRNNILINTSDGSLITGLTFYSIASNWGFVRLMWSGSQWVRTG